MLLLNDSKFSNNEVSFTQNSGTTYWSHAEQGWIRPAKHQWYKDTINEYAYADGSGAPGLTQVIKNLGTTKGLQTISFDTIHQGLDNTLRLQVYGIDGNFQLSNWHTTKPVSVDHQTIKVVTLLDTGNLAEQEFNWTNFAWNLDFAQGYEYITLRFITGGVDTSESEFLAIDNVFIDDPTPKIISNGGGETASIDVAEKQTEVTKVIANHPNPEEVLTYTITGYGTDDSLFSIDSASGQLSFKDAPEFETPTDADQNGVYEVEVQVSDSNGDIDQQIIEVTVYQQNITDSYFSNEEATFQQNSGTTYWSHAGQGWIRPIKHQWNKDTSNEYAYADDSGASGLTQVIESKYTLEGLQTISFDAIHQGLDNTLRLQVYGIDGQFQMSNWNTDSPVSATDEPINVVTLLDTDNLAEEEFNNWTNFAWDVDFAQGYEYIALRFTTNGVDSSGFLAIDNVWLTDDPSSVPTNDNNNFPLPVDDSVTTTINTPIIIDVLSNDEEPDGDTFSIESFTQPHNGTVVLNEDGTFTYTPAADLPGQNSFSYTITDEHGATDTATVNITITIPSMEIGTNLNGIADWSPQIPFLDGFRSSRTWIPQKDGVWSTGEHEQIDVDENGWVRSLPDSDDSVEFTHVSTLLFREIHGQYSGGEYVVLYEGEGTIEYRFNAKLISSTPGRDVIEVNPSHSGILLTITETDPHQTGNYLHDIRVVPAAYEDKYETEIFNPDWLNKIDSFGSLRFMDWMKTNNSTQSEWSKRPTLDSSTWSKLGAPVEIMVELANRIDAAPWFNMPHMVTDEYVRNFAKYVRDNLDPELKVYVEYSNEVWNPQFEQYHWVKEQAQSAGLQHSDWYSKRTTEITQIWDEVFGATKDRLIGVMAGQAANPWVLEQALNYNWSSENKSHQDYGIDAISIAGYVGINKITTQDEIESWLDEPDGGLNSLFDKLTQGGLQRSHDNWQKHLDLAKQEGLPLIAYEGGQHLAANTFTTNYNNEAITNLFIEANRDPRMGEVYKELMTQWHEMGGSLFMHFNDVSTPSKYGSWGLLESIYQDSSPKYDAVMDLLNVVSQ